MSIVDNNSVRFSSVDNDPIISRRDKINAAAAVCLGVLLTATLSEARIPASLNLASVILILCLQGETVRKVIEVAFVVLTFMFMTYQPFSLMSRVQAAGLHAAGSVVALALGRGLLMDWALSRRDYDKLDRFSIGLGLNVGALAGVYALHFAKWPVVPIVALGAGFATLFISHETGKWGRNHPRHID